MEQYTNAGLRPQRMDYRFMHLKRPELDLEHGLNTYHKEAWSLRIVVSDKIGR